MISERRRHHDRPERALQRGAAPGGAHPLEQRAAAERQREQYRGGAERVGDRHGDAAPGGGPDGDHRREDRSGAGGVDEPERGPHQQAGAEAVPARARPERGETGHARLHALAEARH